MADWLLLQDGLFLYVALFLMLLGGAIGLPIPEDLPLILAGVLVHLDKVTLELVVPVCYAGVLLGDIIIFMIGRAVGPALFQKRWFRKRFPPSKIRRVRLNLEKRSLLMILIARHLFYLRTATFLTCGAVRMSAYRFIAADALAALLSLPIMIGLGYIAAENLNSFLDGVHKTKDIVALVSIVLIAVFIWFRFRKAEQEVSSDAGNGSKSDEESTTTAAAPTVSPD